MGFFSGSETSVVRPIGELFDSGVFSNNPKNADAKRLAGVFEGILNQSGFFQNPEIMNGIISKLANNESFLSDDQRGGVLDAAQGQFNKRGLNRITENEALSALAPHEINARNQGVNTLNSLSGARQGDLSSLFALIQEARPDLLVGSTTTNTSSASGLAKLAGLASVPGTINKGIGDLGSLLTTLQGVPGNVQNFLKPA